MIDQAFPRQEVRAQLFGEYRARGLWGTRTFNDVLEEGCTVTFPDRRFIVASPDRPAELTFRQMHERGLQLAGALHALGLRKGDVLAMEMPNWMEACLTYHACAALGVVVTPIIHIYQAKEVEFILRQSRAKVFMVPDTWRGVDYLAMVQEIRPRLPDLQNVIVVGEKVPDDCLSFGDVAERATPDFPRPNISPDEPHILAYTSGTTSDPKGVVHSHNTLLSELRAIAAASGGGPDDVFLCPNPIGHIAGIYSALIAPFMLGYKALVLMDGWDPSWALQLIQEHRITFTGGATFFLATLLNAPNFKDYDVSSLREFGLGGAGVPPTLVEQAAGVGWWSMRAYGCTEHPSITMGTKDDPLEKRAHTDGRPMLDVEVRLIDDDLNDVGPGEEGEIISRGPDQFLGYMDPAMDADAFTEDGWFRTGDIGRFDAEGYLTITDRKKDIIIRGGENISAREVEEILAEHPKVQEAAVTPVSDERYGERVCAFVITRESQPLTLNEVLEHFKARGVAKQKTPERLEIVDAFPRTLSGKVQKYVLRRGIERA
ncbi:MAG: cyclohexanecarboxylate-CoA ligase [Actinobacteria bacterium]|nr:MAG: cyclohexanecarboxylate-CoA ligase [Actinomycetota bacterium]